MHNLEKYLHENGFKFISISLGGNQNIAKIISNFLIYLGIFTYFDYADKTIVKTANIRKIKPLYAIWPLIQFTSILPYIAIARLGPLFGYMVVADQYIFHFVIMLKAFYEYYGTGTCFLKFINNLVLRLVSKKSLTFVFFGEDSELKKRVIKRGTPVEPNRSFIYYSVMPRLLCNQYKHCFCLKTTDKVPAETFEEVRNILNLGI